MDGLNALLHLFLYVLLGPVQDHVFKVAPASATSKPFEPGRHK